MNLNELRLCLTYVGHLNDDELKLSAELFAELLSSFDDYEELEDFIVGKAVQLNFKNHDVAKKSVTEYENIGGKWRIKDSSGLATSKHKTKCSRVFGDLLSFAATSLLFNSEYKDVAFDLIASGIHIKYMPDGVNLTMARRKDGSLIPRNEFGAWLNYKKTMNFLLSSTICAGDLEGLRHLLSINKIRAAFPDIIQWMARSRIDKNNPCWGIMEAEEVKQFSDYARELIKIVKANFKEKALEIYLKEMSAKGGHEIIAAIADRENNAAVEICQRIVRDGADWYLSYRMVRDGRFVVVDLADREKRPVEELIEMLDTIDLKAIHKTQWYVCPLVAAVDYAIRMEVASKSSDYADKLYKVSPHPDIIPLMSKKARGSALANELSI